jgi:hypothetical protein
MLSLSDEFLGILGISGETMPSAETIQERCSTKNQLDHVAVKCTKGAMLDYFWCKTLK